jgi:hypothetical protein
MDPPLPTAAQRAEPRGRLAQLRARAEALRTDDDAEAARLDAEAYKVLLTINALERACDAAAAAAVAAAAAAAGPAGPAESAGPAADEEARRRANFEALGVARERLRAAPSPAERELRRLRLRAWALLHDATARLDRVLDAAPCPARDPAPGKDGKSRATPPCTRTAAALPALPSLGEAWVATEARSRRQAAARRALASRRLQPPVGKLGQS